MARVICKLENASENIGGVKFATHAAGGMVSEEISDETAANFCAINGYELFDAKAWAESQKKNKVAPTGAAGAPSGAPGANGGSTGSDGGDPK